MIFIHTQIIITMSDLVSSAGIFKHIYLTQIKIEIRFENYTCLLMFVVKSIIIWCTIIKNNLSKNLSQQWKKLRRSGNTCTIRLDRIKSKCSQRGSILRQSITIDIIFLSRARSFLTNTHSVCL